MTSLGQIVLLSEKPALVPSALALNNSSAWPVFMGHDPVGIRYFIRLYRDFLDYQFVWLGADDAVIGVGNCIPLAWDASLPEHGWDWALEKGVRDREACIAPTLLSALAITVRQDHQGRGLSATMIGAMKQVGFDHGLKTLIVPARPTRKAAYPLTSIERYIEWCDGAGMPFDPWLRAHVRLGAAIIGPARQSMTITGTVAQWEAWTRMRFPDSGRYVVPEALVPVTIDRERDEGCYVEPNVWLRHLIA